MICSESQFRLTSGGDFPALPRLRTTAISSVRSDSRGAFIGMDSGPGLVGIGGGNLADGILRGLQHTHHLIDLDEVTSLGAEPGEV
jgi:hypothetical protein